MHSAFSHSVRVAEKGRPDNEVMVKSVAVFEIGLWSATFMHQPPAPTVLILQYCITNVLIFVCRARDT